MGIGFVKMKITKKAKFSKLRNFEILLSQSFYQMGFGSHIYRPKWVSNLETHIGLWETHMGLRFRDPYGSLETQMGLRSRDLNGSQI